MHCSLCGIALSIIAYFLKKIKRGKGFPLKMGIMMQYGSPCMYSEPQSVKKHFVPKGTKERHTKRTGRGSFLQKTPPLKKTVHRTIFLIHP